MIASLSTTLLVKLGYVVSILGYRNTRDAVEGVHTI